MSPKYTQNTHAHLQLIDQLDHRGVLHDGEQESPLLQLCIRLGLVQSRLKYNLGIIYTYDIGNESMNE